MPKLESKYLIDIHSGITETATYKGVSIRLEALKLQLETGGRGVASISRAHRNAKKSGSNGVKLYDNKWKHVGYLCFLIVGK